MPPRSPSEKEPAPSTYIQSCCIAGLSSGRDVASRATGFGMSWSSRGVLMSYVEFFYIFNPPSRASLWLDV